MSYCALSRRRLLGASLLGASRLGGTPRRLPNFVFFLSDDLGYADLSCYGARDIRTPHLDRLARQGVRFTHCYANAPVCTPTRVGFLTGRYQQRFGRDLEDALGPANNRTSGLLPRHSVLPQSLKARGYRAGIFGKWHVGWREEFRPLRHGFDEFFGILLGNVDMYTHRYHDGTADLWDNDQPVQRSGYLTDLLAERAVDFVRRRRDEPFFLYVPFNAPHWPFQPPGKPDAVRTAENWRDGVRADYARMVESMDAAVGAVLEELRRQRLEEDTIVVFTNDNGGERLSEGGPLFHSKGTLFEGGIRVPAILRYPGVVPAGSVTAQTAITMDFTATFLAAAGVTGAALDGMDLLPVLRPGGATRERSLFWRISKPGRQQFAVRRGRWKYIDDNTGNRNLPELLFDVVADPGERRNLFHQHQDVAASLRQAYLDWEKSLEAGSAPSSQN